MARVPISNDYNLILIVVAYLIKTRYCILYITDKNGFITEVTKKLLLNYVYKLYTLSLFLILDKGSQFNL